jgi:sulfhydrogenase subunit beta (sulfur reductase)
MTDHILNINTTVAISKPELNKLLTKLKGAGYKTIGPVVKNKSLVYEQIEGLSDLPYGYETDQKPGQYRIHKNGGSEYFQATPGASTWKKYLTPPRTKLFGLVNIDNNWKEVPVSEIHPRYVFIGVRPCEIEAIKIQDSVLIRDDYVDPLYKKIRDDLIIIAVNCLHPADTCFCTSVGGSPEAKDGYDLRLTELDDMFLVNIGSQRGIDMVELMEYATANALSLQIEDEMLVEAKAKVHVGINNNQNLPELLMNNLKDPAWEVVGAKCLNCGSCTSVCPTCFCWDVQDVTNLHGTETQRDKIWDSCFNPSFTAHAGGGSSRPTTTSRLRQRLTHKFGSWVEQHGGEGCVGCGRCIAWCPAKIDIREEISVLQEVFK